MIRLLKEGTYRLIESKSQTKILTLDSQFSYAWIMAYDIGEILVSSHQTHAEDCVLSVGKYRIYEVEQESNLSDQLHIELCVGTGLWQGYLLPTGLPTETKKRSRIIPTQEVISRTSRRIYTIPSTTT